MGVTDLDYSADLCLPADAVSRPIESMPTLYRHTALLTEHFIYEIPAYTADKFCAKGI